MSDSFAAPAFSVIPGTRVDQVLRGREHAVIDLVEGAYRLHGAGRTVNPPSYFLRFPDRPTARIIALPASLGGPAPADGLKWISSFPDNLARGLPRASAVLILNDPATGYPRACMEASIISASRTAASAALAADALTRSRAARPARIGFFGGGLIARFVHTYLAGGGWSFEQAGVYDLDAGYAGEFAAYLERADPKLPVRIHPEPEELIRDSDLIVFATTAGTPHVDEPDWFGHAPVVLHLSLRDLSPRVILSAANFVDDVEHCLKAATSVHLTEQQEAGRGFLSGTLYDVLTGAAAVPTDRPVVFSPFGLGVLDLAVAGYVYEELAAAGRLDVVEGFFSELDRYARPDGSRGATGQPA
jgi:ornithine cyclodeaminase